MISQSLERMRFDVEICISFFNLAGTLTDSRGSAQSLPGPMFPSTYVPRFMILVSMFPMFPSPYVTQKCFPVPLLTKLILPSPYVPQYLCSPVHLFPSPYRCSQVPMFPSPYDPPTSSPVPIFPSPVPQKCFPFPMFPNMFPSTYVLQCPWSKIGESHFWIWGGTHLGRVAHISSIRIVIIASQKTRTGELRDWGTGWGTRGLGDNGTREYVGEHRHQGTSTL